MKLLPLVLLATACTLPDIPDLPGAQPTPEPTPCPTPAPPPKPAAGLLNAPDVVPVAAPFAVTLCKPWTPNTVLYVDQYKLVTFGHHRPTGCMIVIVPGLNTPGDRILKVGDLTRPIHVFGAQNLTAK